MIRFNWTYLAVYWRQIIYDLQIFFCSFNENKFNGNKKKSVNRILVMDMCVKFQVKSFNVKRSVF